MLYSFEIFCICLNGLNLEVHKFFGLDRFHSLRKQCNLQRASIRSISPERGQPPYFQSLGNIQIAVNYKHIIYFFGINKKSSLFKIMCFEHLRKERSLPTSNW